MRSGVREAGIWVRMLTVDGDRLESSRSGNKKKSSRVSLASKESEQTWCEGEWFSISMTGPDDVARVVVSRLFLLPLLTFSDLVLLLEYSSFKESEAHDSSLQMMSCLKMISCCWAASANLVKYRFSFSSNAWFREMFIWEEPLRDEISRRRTQSWHNLASMSLLSGVMLLLDLFLCNFSTSGTSGESIESCGLSSRLLLVNEELVTRGGWPMDLIKLDSVVLDPDRLELNDDLVVVEVVLKEDDAWLDLFAGFQGPWVASFPFRRMTASMTLMGILGCFQLLDGEDGRLSEVMLLLLTLFDWTDSCRSEVLFLSFQNHVAALFSLVFSRLNPEPTCLWLLMLLLLQFLPKSCWMSLMYIGLPWRGSPHWQTPMTTCPGSEAEAVALLFSAAEFVLRGVCRFEKFDEFLPLPMPRVTRDSSILLQSMAQSFLNCLVKMAYKNGLQHELSGRTKMVKILASSKEIKLNPQTAIKEKKAIGAQHKKSVKTSNAILLAILESFEFHAWDPLMAQYILR